MILHSSSRYVCMYTYVLRTTRYLRQKKTEKRNGGQVSGWTCRTCVQNFRVYLLKTARKFGLLTCVFYVVACNCLVLVYDRVFCVRLHWIFYTGRSDLRMLPWKKNTFDMPWSTCSRLVQKKMGKYMFFLRKRLTIFGLFDGLWSVGTRFRHQR